MASETSTLVKEENPKVEPQVLREFVHTPVLPRGQRIDMVAQHDVLRAVRKPKAAA